MEKIPSCHPDRKHLAHGMCKPCYDIWYRQSNREKVNAKQRKWAKANKNKVDAARRKYIYGMNEKQFMARLAAQDGLCKICRKEPGTDVDHNHVTVQNRSILCGNCNRALGLFRENKETLHNAILYLELWENAPDENILGSTVPKER